MVLIRSRCASAESGATLPLCCDAAAYPLGWRTRRRGVRLRVIARWREALATHLPQAHSLPQPDVLAAAT
jgi:hypothetical protein